MAYAILRCKKLASAGSVASSLKHCYRDRETPNADAARTSENEHHSAKSTDEAMGKLRELLPAKRRKDAVLVVEYMLTASPEWWKQASQAQQADFFTRSKEWLAEKYRANRIIVATVHRDETSPHLSAFVVPLTQDGRLSAKEFIGDRQKMRGDQTSYAQRVADLGLERGIEGSRARHQTVRSYYAALEQEQRPVKITPESIEPRKYKAEGLTEKLGLTKRVETTEAVAERLTAAVHAAYAPAVKAAAGARQEREKTRQAQETARDLRNRLKPVLDALQPLTEVNRAKVASLIISVGEKALAMQQEGLKKKQEVRQQERGRDRGGYSR